MGSVHVFQRNNSRSAVALNERCIVSAWLHTRELPVACAFACVFRPGDVGTVQPAGHAQANAKRAHVHGHLDRPLHCPPEGDATLELHADVLGNQLGIKFRILDLGDLNVDFLAGHPAEFFLDLVDLGTLASNHHSRPQ